MFDLVQRNTSTFFFSSLTRKCGRESFTYWTGLCFVPSEQINVLRWKARINFISSFEFVEVHFLLCLCILSLNYVLCMPMCKEMWDQADVCGAGQAWGNNLQLTWPEPEEQLWE